MQGFFKRRMQWPRARGPARDLSVALAVKFGLLLGIYALCFGPAHRVPSDAGSTASALIGPTAPAGSR